MDCIDIDDLVAKLPDEKFKLAHERATQAFGGFVADEESDEFVEEFANQLKLIVAKEMTEDLCSRGYLEPDGVDDEGNVIYRETEKGRNATGTDGGSQEEATGGAA